MRWVARCAWARPRPNGPNIHWPPSAAITAITARPRAASPPRPRAPRPIPWTAAIAKNGSTSAAYWNTIEWFSRRHDSRCSAITGSAEAILLGRRTYEMFAPAWSSRTAEDDPGAPFFNDTHKYVVASQQPASSVSGHPQQLPTQQPPRQPTFEDSDDLDVPDFLK